MNTTILGDLDVLDEQIGHGANGIVYRVKNNDKVFAVKKIDKLALRRTNREEQMKREIQILKTICHPNIASFFSYKEDKNYFYLTMEYCDGQNLRDFLLKSQIQEEMIPYFGTKVMLDYISALCHIRSKRVVNRDIKPDNIMIKISENKQIQVKIVDFGEAKFMVKQAESYVGTPYYMAPQVHNKGEYSDSCDIWSLGVTIFQAFQGKNPCIRNQKNLGLPHKENINLTNFQYQSNYYKNDVKMGLNLSKKRIPALIRDILREMLRQNPEQRITFLKIVNVLESRFHQIEYLFTSNEYKAYLNDIQNCIIIQKQIMHLKNEQQSIEKSIENLYQKILVPIKTEIKKVNKSNDTELLLFIRLVINKIIMNVFELKELLSKNPAIMDEVLSEKNLNEDEVISYGQNINNELVFRKVDPRLSESIKSLPKSVDKLLKEKFMLQYASMLRIINESQIF